MTQFLKHLFVTQDFGPDRGGMARRHVEVCRRFSDESNSMSVSTVQLDYSAEFDAAENYRIDRQPFYFREANRFTNQVRWARWLTNFAESSADVIHLGNIRPVGYAVGWAHARLRLPYMLYVNGGDLLREQRKTARSAIKRRTARRIIGEAAGIVATSRWVADLTHVVLDEIGVETPPPVAVLDLGTDPTVFSPGRDAGILRAKWNVADAPLLLTVARLVPHKGQDTVIRALAALSQDVPSLHYVLVGEGHDELRLRALAAELAVEDRVIFAGALPEDELPEAYATANVYVGASRLDNTVNVEGFGISFLEASASGLPVVAGDSGGVRSAVRDGVTGMVVGPESVAEIAAAVLSFLRDPVRAELFGSAGRVAVETHFNWDRVAADTREFTLSVVRGPRASR